MGEVYRADDLKLGQPVALKFLPADVDRDPARLMQLHNEVRMARQVSHPNVCRVYDIDEVDDHTFISMEYVDGEELASIIRRFGRFSPDRAIELARQICAGLTAAHERGVVHRDFKPANVMIDGSGKVRITDFGLAGLTGEALRAGTPAYMAPEQIAGGQVTARSDIYALGLVLYELFTGHRAFEGRTIPELLRKRDEGAIPPSTLVPEIAEAVDRAILRCVELDPANRPSNAMAVSAALPGGDPLAAALAAGETPSPEMVAASGTSSALAPLPALSALGATFAGLVVFAALSDRALVTGYLPLQRPPEVLIDRARQISSMLGYTDAPADSAWGFTADSDYLRFSRDRGDAAALRERLRTGRPAVLQLWHRTSPGVMVPVGEDERVSDTNPPLSVPTMRSLTIDSEGRLVRFRAVPAQVEGPDASGGSVNRQPTNWARLFETAGLQQSDFRAVAPQWTPQAYADERAAWEGPLPGLPDQPLRIEAAAYKGRIVSVDLIHPWTEPVSFGDSSRSTGQKVAQTVVGIALVLVLSAAVLVARHNLRKGRGDRRGALRISSLVLACSVLAFLAGWAHYADVSTEVGRIFTAAGESLLEAGLLWLLYLALEPYVRKFWPQTLVSWSRVFAGKWMDPQVGRDVLLGTLFAVAVQVVGRVDDPLRSALGFPVLPPSIPNINQLEGVREVISTVSELVFGALFNSLWILFGLVVLNLITRRAWISAIVMGLFLMTTSAGNIAELPPYWLSALFAAVMVSSMVFIMFRYGLLATIVFFFVSFTLGSSVPTLNPSLWFFPQWVGLMLFVAALAAFGFYASRGGDPLFGRRLLD
jgi:serine/threonine-protein kinase